MNLPSAEIIFDPILPIPAIIALGAVLAFLTIRIYLRVGSSLNRWRSILLLLLRIAGIAMIILLLLQPSRREVLPPPNKERATLVALDTSLSMKQRDADKTTRFDAARNLLMDSGLIGRNGVAENPRIRAFEFGDDAKPLQKSLFNLSPTAKTTRLHRSITTMLNTPSADESVNALILVTDGHDFELVNPAKTGTAARARQIPIYAVAMGKQGKVRDAATRITGFQPYCYVKQKAHINATVRLIGCEFEDLTVQLLRQGQVVQTKKINANELQELPVEFEVTEPEVGQYEYEVRVLPLENEADTANNSAITYLNVIDQQIRVLLVEGDPYWDTTFLQRSLMRNDKFVVDALIRYGQNHVRAIRKTSAVADALHIPNTLDEFSSYDVVILGRDVDSVMSAQQVSLLNQFVKDRAGTVIFSRGPAFANAALSGGLEPVIWSEKGRDRVHLDLAPEGRSLSALRSLNGETQSGLDALPDLLNGKSATETQPLTATLATAAGRDDPTTAPAIVHRKYGNGQVVSLGVEGLWRWSMNSKVEGNNTPFDRFWDQMVLWLLAGRDFIPTRQFSFRPSSANVLLGERAHLRLTARQTVAGLKSVPLTIYLGDAEAGRADMTANSGDPGHFAADFLPERIGRYRAVAKFPDGTSQESRFIVYTENLEETEVATDVGYLRRLCESSGGKLIQPGELSRLMQELNNEKADSTPHTRIKPVWNQAWVFYLTVLMLGLDWFLRRRWGLC